MNFNPEQIFPVFQLDSAVINFNRHGSGHINQTYALTCESGKRYILQRINHHVFRTVEGLMANMVAVTEYLNSHTDDPRTVLRVIPTVDGKSYYQHTDGNYWRVCDFVDGSICLDAPETPEDFYQSAIAFGTFQQQLRDFPAHTLFETIKNFHNTPDRYRIFKEVLAKLQKITP